LQEDGFIADYSGLSLVTRVPEPEFPNSLLSSFPSHKSKSRHGPQPLPQPPFVASLAQGKSLLFFLLIHARPAAAPAAMTATEAGPVWPAGPVEEMRTIPPGSKTRSVAKSGEPEEGGRVMTGWEEEEKLDTSGAT